MKRIFENLKQLFYKYNHAWVLLYVFIYIPWFTWLEDTVTEDYYVIHCIFDDYIPFIELFIIPYVIWFLFIAVTLLYFFFTDKQGFYKATALLFTGMTIFLIICTVFPNGLNLRPTEFTRDNILIDMVRMIYATDTPTNVLPSLHVYNSIGCYLAIRQSETLRQQKWIQIGSFILALLIVLSTIFLKQHSIIDVVAAAVMAYFLYQLIYVPEKATSPEFTQQII